MSMIQLSHVKPAKKSYARYIVIVLGLILFLNSKGIGQELTITSPTRETIWVEGTIQEITWTGGSSENVDIKMYWGDGNEYIIAKNTPNDGSFTWFVPYGGTKVMSIWIYGNEYAWSSFIRESSRGGIYITSPVWYDNWQMGSTYDITWTGNFSENVEISLYKLISGETGEKSFVSTITSSTPSDGHYSWTVPFGLTLEREFVIRIQGVYSQSFDIVEQTSSCADVYEPNDEIAHPNGWAFSSSIGDSYFQSESISGTIHEYGDWDHYRLNIEYTGNLDINLTNVPEGFDLQLYNNEPSGYVAGSFTDGDENLNVNITSPGFYYIIVGSMESAYGCSPYNLAVDWTPDLTLNATPTSSRVGPKQGTTTFEVSSNANWSASEQATWLSAEKTNPELLTVTFDENYSADRRSAGITLSADGVSPIIVAVNQEGTPCTLSVSPDTLIVGSGRGTSTFNVTSNVSWSAYLDETWLEIFYTDSAKIIVGYWNNPSTNANTANLIIVGEACSEVVSITQEGAACSLIVTPESQNVGSEAGTTSFTVTSNVSWSVSESEEWMSTSIDGSSITINYLENTSIDSRAAILSVSGGDCLDTVTVTQEGAACSLIVSPESQNVGSEAGTTSFTVTSNVSWSVNESSEWLSTSVDGSLITISYLENISIESRADTIYISGGDCSETVTVTQEGVQPLFQVGTNNISLGASEGSTGSFQITANVGWSIQKNAQWLFVDPLSGTGSILVMVEAIITNNTGETRTDTLRVTGNGVTYLIVITQDFITGVIELLESGINLYPNPSGSELYVNMGMVLEDFTVRITDSRGSYMFGKSYTKATEFTIDLGMFNNGIFQIVIMHMDGSIVRTFIKR